MNAETTVTRESLADLVKAERALWSKLERAELALRIAREDDAGLDELERMKGERAGAQSQWATIYNEIKALVPPAAESALGIPAADIRRYL